MNQLKKILPSDICKYILADYLSRNKIQWKTIFTESIDEINFTNTFHINASYFFSDYHIDIVELPFYKYMLRKNNRRTIVHNFKIRGQPHLSASVTYNYNNGKKPIVLNL